MKAFRFIAALLLFFSIAIRADGPVKPMVVLFYADWCYNCKILLPKLDEAQKGLETDLLFVRLDSTDEAAKADSRDRAKKLGISKLWFSNHATGWAALFNTRHEQVGELKQDMSVEELRSRLETLAGKKAAPPAAS